MEKVGNFLIPSIGYTLTNSGNTIMGKIIALSIYDSIDNYTEITDEQSLLIKEEQNILNIEKMKIVPKI